MSFRKKSDDGYAAMAPGISMKTLVHGERTLTVEFRLRKDSTLPLHSHPHEQTGYLVSGHMILTIGDEPCDVRPGDSWCVPGGVQHGASVEEDSVAVEVFSPVREEYLRL